MTVIKKGKLKMLISSINSISKSNYKHSHESSANKKKVSFGNGAQTFIHAVQVVEALGLLTVIGFLARSIRYNHKFDKAILKIIPKAKKRINM